MKKPVPDEDSTSTSVLGADELFHVGQHTREQSAELAVR